MASDLHRGWIDKFRDALRGCKLGFRGQSSFFAHIFAAALVVAVAWVARAGRTEWCLLLICITVVITTEMLNTSIESLARAITREHHPDIGLRVGHRRRRGPSGGDRRSDGRPDRPPAAAGRPVWLACVAIRSIVNDRC
ncbi:MAG: diacylglycerol kinase [Pirellulales bacterium]